MPCWPVRDEFLACFYTVGTRSGQTELRPESIFGTTTGFLSCSLTQMKNIKSDHWWNQNGSQWFWMSSQYDENFQIMVYKQDHFIIIFCIKQNLKYSLIHINHNQFSFLILLFVFKQSASAIWLNKSLNLRQSELVVGPTRWWCK